ncbi:nuclear transport factor 2 family protein [Luteibacter sp.]|uniref:nuclear transport factor 2 family protein n=1 Tax=Luteibacter sp. TaxID=1886636 RepID=UPI0025B84751|nr:nuclear transport factor 2 family protein [Luteibacter sp.]
MSAAVFLGFAGMAHAATAEADALKTVNDFLQDITRRDKAAMLASAVPHMEILSARKSAEGGLRRLTIEQLVDLIAAQPPGKMVQTLHNPIVHVDNDLAVVWSPYTWTLDGHFSHCASESFNLLKLNGKWVMVSVVDTARDDEKTCSG